MKINLQFIFVWKGILLIRAVTDCRDQEYSNTKVEFSWFWDWRDVDVILPIQLSLLKDLEGLKTHPIYQAYKLEDELHQDGVSRKVIKCSLIPSWCTWIWKSDTGCACTLHQGHRQKLSAGSFLSAWSFSKAAALMCQKICASVPAGNTCPSLLHLSFHQTGNTDSSHCYYCKIVSHFKHQH